MLSHSLDLVQRNDRQATPLGDPSRQTGGPCTSPKVGVSACATRCDGCQNPTSCRAPPCAHHSPQYVRPLEALGSKTVALRVLLHASEDCISALLVLALLQTIGPIRSKSVVLARVGPNHPKFAEIIRDRGKVARIGRAHRKNGPTSSELVEVTPQAWPPLRPEAVEVTPVLANSPRICGNRATQSTPPRSVDPRSNFDRCGFPDQNLLHRAPAGNLTFGCQRLRQEIRDLSKERLPQRSPTPCVMRCACTRWRAQRMHIHAV